VANPNRTVAEFRRKHGYSESHHQRIRERRERETLEKEKVASEFTSWEQVEALAQTEDPNKVAVLIMTLVRIRSIPFCDKWDIHSACAIATDAEARANNLERSC